MQFAYFPKMMLSCRLPINPLELILQNADPDALFPNGQCFTHREYLARYGEYKYLNVCVKRSCYEIYATQADRELGQEQARVFDKVMRPNPESARIWKFKGTWYQKLHARMQLEGYWDYCYFQDDQLISKWEMAQEYIGQREWDIRIDVQKELREGFMGNCVRLDPGWETLYIEYKWHPYLEREWRRQKDVYCVLEGFLGECNDFRNVSFHRRSKLRPSCLDYDRGLELRFLDHFQVPAEPLLIKLAGQFRCQMLYHVTNRLDREKPCDFQICGRIHPDHPKVPRASE
ncbi:hypothetical protein QBC38DRAFT_458624 [Podospora fimiseda]|uniref:Uncharacterized protein n=1 Tax=Podospora fimiseda TaxID=252190 RepID=A0AAN7BIN0_9PEZI|nr:hypothetical protein QBC38DRAFT_458624 [Podospora fimiseda]